MSEGNLQPSFTSGGPFAPLLRRMGLHSNRRHLWRHAWICAAIAWLPLVMLGIGQKAFSGQTDPLLRDFSVHVRALVAIPLFFFADAVLEALWARTIDRFLAGHFVDDATQVSVESLCARSNMVKDSWRVELTILVLVLALMLASLFGLFGLKSYLPGPSAGQPWPAVRIYYKIVTLPLFQFLLLRLLWLWTFWSYLLIKLSRFELRLTPTHPDSAGGIGFLCDPTSGFAILAFASNSVVASTFATQMLYMGAKLRSFAPTIVSFTLLALLFAFAPLLGFSKHLIRARFIGSDQYGRLALFVTRTFQIRWIEREATESILDRSDVSVLADLSTAYKNLTAMTALMFGRWRILMLLIATLLPIVPLFAIEIPIQQLLIRIGRALLGSSSH